MKSWRTRSSRVQPRGVPGQQQVSVILTVRHVQLMESVMPGIGRRRDLQRRLEPPAFHVLDELRQTDQVPDGTPQIIRLAQAQQAARGVVDQLDLPLAVESYRGVGQGTGSLPIPVQLALQRGVLRSLRTPIPLRQAPMDLAPDTAALRRGPAQAGAPRQPASQQAVWPGKAASPGTGPAQRPKGAAANPPPGPGPGMRRPGPGPGPAQYATDHSRVELPGEAIPRPMDRLDIAVESRI
jgi:hypothetical protein